jgi:hypothetical protein
MLIPNYEKQNYYRLHLFEFGIVLDLRLLGPKQQMSSETQLFGFGLKTVSTIILQNLE